MAEHVVFVHGMYLNGRSWQPWRDRAADQERGWVGHAPSWPFHDGDPAQLRETIPSGLGRLTFGQVIEHLKAVIDDLPSRPVLVGHSIGGLAVQRLLADGYGTAAVAISPAPPRGVVSFDPHFLRANWAHVNPFAGNRPVLMTPERFHYAFANTISRAESDAFLEQYVVPESRNVPRSTLTKQGAIDFRGAHRPLLVLAAESDHLTPRDAIKRNVAKYRKGDAVVDHREFPGRSHLLCNEPGWEEVADACFDWIERQ